MKARAPELPAEPHPLISAADKQRPLRVLTVSGVFPSVADPLQGVFVKERARAVASLSDTQVRVVAPIPWFPDVPLFAKPFGNWYRWSQFPRLENVDGLEVFHPRYPLLPKVGGIIHPQLMSRALRRIATRLRGEFPFDLIDAHWVHPYGAAAVHVARHFGVPVVMTGRGQDMLCAPSERIVGRSVRWALAEGSAFIAVSRQIAAAMIEHGAAAERVHVIPNGVDTQKFHQLDQRACREALRLPADRRIVLSVGSRLELKGFHLLVEALPEIRRVYPDAYLVIVGGPGRHGQDYTADIEARVDQSGLRDHVLLAGGRPHQELVQWHNAADVFALLSSREGSSNALLEALASGLPAATTAVGGMMDELQDPRLGSLVEDRSAAAAATAIIGLFAQPRDRQQIAGIMQARPWSRTAENVREVFLQAIRFYQERAA